MKRTLVLGLTAVLVLTLTAVPALAYTDIAGLWNNDQNIQQAINQWGVTIAPDTSKEFYPNQYVTRAEFAHIVNLLTKYTAATPTFTDVANNRYAADIGALQKAGVVNGKVAGVLFDPDAPLTRQEAAKMTGVAFKLPASSDDTAFSDDAAIELWAKPYVQSLQVFHFIQGRDENVFDPQAYLTRAEIMMIAWNITPGTPVKDANYVHQGSGDIKDKTFNNLIISADSTGTITLENVTVNGSIIILGSAEVIIKGTSKVGQLFIHNSSVITIDAEVGQVVIDSPTVDLTVGPNGNVTAIVVPSASVGVVITNNGRIGTIDDYAFDTAIHNNGTIVTINHPSSVTVTGDPVENDNIIDEGIANDIYG